MNQTVLLMRIQRDLEEYHRIAKFVASSKDQDYDLLFIRGGCICEEMLQLICLNKGYVFDDAGRIEIEKGLVFGPIMSVFREENESLRTDESSYIAHQRTIYKSVADDILPKECQQFILLIKRFRNQAAHGLRATNEMAIEFARAMDYFTIWFRETYASSIEIDEMLSQKLSGRFFSLQELLSFPDESTQALKADDSISKLLSKISEQSVLIVKLSQQVTNIELQGQRIEKAVTEIQQSLKELSNQITAYQSLVERQLNYSGSDAETDRIIQAFSEECTSRIISSLKAENESQLFELEKRKLVASLGANAWNKLDETSKTFLISSKVMYNNLILLDDCLDYSGVCLLVTKALEVEMSKRFCRGFLSYLDRTYHRDYSKYPTTLLGQYMRPLPLEKFTMGSYAFILCLYNDRNESSAQRVYNKQRLIEYASRCVFTNKTSVQIESLLRSYAQDIDDIRQRYRNPAAHTNMLKKNDAESCFDLVLDVEKLLKKMLDSFSS